MGVWVQQQLPYKAAFHQPPADVVVIPIHPPHSFLVPCLPRISSSKVSDFLDPKEIEYTAIAETDLVVLMVVLPLVLIPITFPQILICSRIIKTQFFIGCFEVTRPFDSIKWATLREARLANNL